MDLLLVRKKTTTASNKTTVPGKTTKITAKSTTEAHKHVYNKEVVDSKYLANEATCTEKAKYYKSCACGEKGSETFEGGEALGHTCDATGYCSRCKKDLGHTVTWDEVKLSYWYLHLEPIGNKLYINFTALKDATLYFDLEGQQYFDNCITEDDLDLNPVKGVKLFEEGNLKDEIAFEDIDYIGSDYFYWDTVDELSSGTKYYLELTLDKEYDEFILYFGGVEKGYNSSYSPIITTTKCYKFYDGEPFVVEATPTSGSVTVYYYTSYYKLGTTTAPKDPGYYFVYAFGEDEDCYNYSYYEFEIIDAEKEIEVGEYYEVYNQYIDVDSKIKTKVYLEKGKTYAVYAENNCWEYEVTDSTSTYDIDFDSGWHHFITAKETGYITITGTKVSPDTDAYLAAVYDVIEINDLTKDNKMSIYPGGSQILKISKDAAKYINVSSDSISDESGEQVIYFYFFDLSNTSTNEAILVGKNYFYNFDTPEDYYIEVYNDSDEIQQFNFKVAPLEFAEAKIDEVYIDEASKDADTYTFNGYKVKLTKDEEYLILMPYGYHGYIYDEDLVLFDDFETDYVYKALKDEYIYILGYKDESDAAMFVRAIYKGTEMTDPYNSDNKNNKVTIAPTGICVLTFEIENATPIKLNKDISESVYPMIIDAQDNSFYYFNEVNGFLTSYYSDSVFVLQPGKYFLYLSNMSETDSIDVNAYLVCMHDDELSTALNDHGVCLNCGECVGSE